MNFNIEKKDYNSGKSAKDSGVSQNFLKKKKNRPSKSGKKLNDENYDARQSIEQLSPIENEKIEIGERFCICNGPSFGDMVKCDNDSVYKNNLVQNRMVSF